MPRPKPQENHSLLLPVVLGEQIVPGSFAFASQVKLQAQKCRLLLQNSTASERFRSRWRYFTPDRCLSLIVQSCYLYFSSSVRPLIWASPATYVRRRSRLELQLQRILQTPSFECGICQTAATLRLLPIPALGRMSRMNYPNVSAWSGLFAINEHGR
jgi:hypothetical protein